MDTNYLDHASICLTELSLTTALKCTRNIRSENIAHWGKDTHIRPMQSVHPCMWSGALISLIDVASQNSSPAPPSIAQELKDMYMSISPVNSHVSSALSHTRLVTVDLVRIIRHYYQDASPSGTMNVAERIRNYCMGHLASNTAGIHLGNDVRRQGECTTIWLACSID